MNQQNFYTAAEMAKRLNMHRDTFRKRVRQGLLPRPTFHYGKLMWNIQSVEEHDKVLTQRYNKEKCYAAE